MKQNTSDNKRCTHLVITPRRIKGCGNKKWYVCEKCGQVFVEFLNTGFINGLKGRVK